jgi:hypothetical protein
MCHIFVLQKLIVLRFCNPKENPLIQRKQTLPKKHNIFEAPGPPPGVLFCRRMPYGMFLHLHKANAIEHRGRHLPTGSVSLNAGSDI